MTRKDFELIARVLSEARVEYDVQDEDWTEMSAREDGRQDIAYRFATVLSTTNPLFDRARFLKACGVA